MTDPQTEALAAAATSAANPVDPAPAGHPSMAGPADTASAAEGAVLEDATPVDPAFERRAFVRRMSGDAVRTAGSVFSISRILTRSAVAAGQAVMGELQALDAGAAAGSAGPPVAEPALAPPPDEPPVPGAPDSASAPAVAQPPVAEPAHAGSRSPAERPALLLDADQRAILESATTAVVAVNWEGHPPQLTTAEVLWDGQTVRFGTLGWSRRTTMLRTDPRISLLVEGPGDGRFVTVVGHARISEGQAARDAMWPLLRRTATDPGEVGAEARWQELVAADADRAVIVVEPDQVLSGRR